MDKWVTLPEKVKDRQGCWNVFTINTRDIKFVASRFINGKEEYSIAFIIHTSDSLDRPVEILRTMRIMAGDYDKILKLLDVTDLV